MSSLSGSEPRNPQQFRLRWRYFVLLTAASALLAITPIAFVAVSFALSGFQGNAFDETGYGAALWLLLVSVPASVIIVVTGTAGGLLVELLRYVRYRRNALQ
jgi:hypothetical protein